MTIIKKSVVRSLQLLRDSEVASYHWASLETFHLVQKKLHLESIWKYKPPSCKLRITVTSHLKFLLIAFGHLFNIFLTILSNTGNPHVMQKRNKCNYFFSINVYFIS